MEDERAYRGSESQWRRESRVGAGNVVYLRSLRQSVDAGFLRERSFLINIDSRRAAIDVCAIARDTLGVVTDAADDVDDDDKRRR